MGSSPMHAPTIIAIVDALSVRSAVPSQLHPRVGVVEHWIHLLHLPGTMVAPTVVLSRVYRINLSLAETVISILH